MTDRQQPGRPGNSGTWQPVPGGGDYDPDQTMHVSFAAQLPPEPRPGEDPLSAHGPAGPGGADAATQWTIPVIRDESDAESGDYSVGSLPGSVWDQAPSPAAPTQSFPAGMFGQGAAAAQAAQAARAAEAAAQGYQAAHDKPGGMQPDNQYQAAQGYQAAHDPSARPGAPERSGEHPADPWAGPYGGQSGGAGPWLPAHAPAADAAWSGAVDDPAAAADAATAHPDHPAAYADPSAPPGPGFGPGASVPGAQAAPYGSAAGASAEASAPPSGAGFGDGPSVPDPSVPGPAVPGPSLPGPSLPGPSLPGIQAPPYGPAAAAADASAMPGPEFSGAQAAPYDPAATSADPSVPPGPGPAASSAASPADDPAPGDRPDAGAADAAASYEPAGHPAVPEGDAPPGAAPGGEEQEGHEEHQAPDAVPAAEAADDSGDGRVNASGKAGGADGTEAADGAEAAGDAEAADGPDGGAVTAAPTRSEHPVASYTLRVNGTDRPVTDAWLGESLLYVLRERLGLAGAKDGCEQGECGACSVQVDGRLVASCLVPAATAAGSEVRTVEGLTVAGAPSDVQRALADCGAVQCGFCIPGLAMTVHDLLEGNHRPTDLEVRQAVSGNLCRCSGYRGVLDAVRQVVAERATDDDGPQKPVDGADPARVPHQGRPPSLPEAHG